MAEGKTQEAAAAAAAMSVRSARKWQDGVLPSETKEARTWRTRKDPFEEVWASKIEPLLGADHKRELEAKTLMELLVEKSPEQFSMGQLRTMQRRVRDWRAMHGSGKEVFFQQEHPPGELCALDFTNCNELEVTIAGQPFRHLLFELVLVYSKWTWACVAFSETFEALVDGLQRALWALGGVPKELLTDNLSAATHDLRNGGGRALTKRFREVCEHLGIERVRQINPGRSHENGAIEVRHRRTKKLLAQALLLRGSSDFESIAAYEEFVRAVLDKRHNAHVADKLAQERALLRELPMRQLPRYTTTTPRVRKWSTITVRGRIYSVPSRLIGYEVEARLHPDVVEVWYRGSLVERFPRLQGSEQHRIDYRHVIASLVRKPGAFAHYRFREELFPTLAFRRAYDALRETHKARADVEYVRILKLAADTMETTVEAALEQLLNTSTIFDYAAVEALARPRVPEVPLVEIGTPELAHYDELLGAAE